MLRTIGSSLVLIAAAVAQGNFPPPPIPTNNPQTPQKVLLGMALFFEEQLSSTGTVACATCHEFSHGGADARTAGAVNPGPDGQFGTADDRNGSPGIAVLTSSGGLVPHPVHGFSPNVTSRRSPSVVNSGYHTHLGYDGGKPSLEALIEVPPLNPVEMGHNGRTWNDVTTKIAAATPLVFASNLPPRLQTFIAGRNYPQLFQAVYGTTEVTKERLVFAIAAYIRTLNSDQSRWDLHLHNQVQLTAEEQLGLQLFMAPANGATACSTCHGDFEQRVLQEGPVAGAMTTTSTGYYGASVQTRLVFHNIGVRPIADDPGRVIVTQQPSDQGKFRTASLRNVELTGPYFHNGRANTLDDVVEFYNRGGDFHVNQAPSLTPRSYGVVQKSAIVALLRTLTDPRLASGAQPFDRPLLGSQNGRLAMATGQGSVGAFGQLVANAPVAPRLGEPWFKLALHGATPNVPSFLMWDTSAAAAPGLWNIQLGITSSFLAVGTGLVNGVWLSPTGLKEVTLPLPSTPSLSGLVLFAQWATLEPSNHGPIATSSLLRIPLL